MKSQLSQKGSEFFFFFSRKIKNGSVLLQAWVVESKKLVTQDDSLKPGS